MSNFHDVVIIGGGAAGISVAARLLREASPPEVAVIEPAESHFYQPLWTLVGAGIFPKEDSARPMARVMPKDVTWIRSRVQSVLPDTHEVELAGGERIGYRFLVVAPGIQLDWDKVKGLREALGKGGVCSNYEYSQASYTWTCLQATKDGRALFTFPAGSIKCAGAPQKIMYLAEEHFRRQGLRSRVNVTYASATAGIFGIPKYARTLNAIVRERGIETSFRKNLVELRAARKQAIFQDLDNGSEHAFDYSMVHVTPPQSAPDFIKQSALAGEGGWVAVDAHTLQHVRYPDVFSLGDASSLPCSKTGAAVRKQAPVLVENLMSHRSGRPLGAHYDGYASCPLVTGYGKVILAEFGYGGKVMETFPFDQAEERFSMYALKAYALPSLYWHGMLQGRL